MVQKRLFEDRYLVYYDAQRAQAADDGLDDYLAAEHWQRALRDARRGSTSTACIAERGLRRRFAITVPGFSGVAAVPAWQRLPGDAAGAAARQPAARLRHGGAAVPLPADRRCSWSGTSATRPTRCTAGCARSCWRSSRPRWPRPNCPLRVATMSERPEDAWPAWPLPVGIRARFVDRVNGLRLHLLEAGEPGRPVRAAAARFSRAGLELAQADAAAGRRRLPRARAGPARLRPQHRLGRPTTTPTCGPSACSTWRAMRSPCSARWTSTRGRGGRPRLRLAGRRVVRAAAARVFRLGGADERALRRSAAGGSARRAHRHPCRPGRTAAAAQALPASLRHARGQPDMWHCPQGVHAFLRAYYHMKSADWPGNRPHALQGWRARGAGADARVLHHGPAPGHGRDRGGAHAHARPGSGLHAGSPKPSWRSMRRSSAAPASRAGCSGTAAARTRPAWRSCRLFAGRTIDVPACFIAGASDWGVLPDARRVAAHAAGACSRLLGMHLDAGAGHWVQQEQPAATLRLLHDFLAMAA